LYVALVTPFTRDGAVDEDALRRLVSFHIEQKTEGLVPCGTTGETPTLSPEEYRRVIRAVVEEARGRLTVVAGAGSQSTDKTIELCRVSIDAGADGLLVVTPYYNKPQPDGLVAHFRRVAEAARAPIMLYNVPGRTGVNMRPETVERLMPVSNIIAIKEASGDVSQSSEILARCGDRFTVLSGDDALTLPILAVGGMGSVSVTGNLVPDRAGDLIRAALAGDYARARALHLELYALNQILFVETSPAPIKYAMGAIGRPVGPVRLPLSELREDSRRKIDGVLATLGLLHGAAR